MARKPKRAAQNFMPPVRDP
jgi:hypothetical protein